MGETGQPLSGNVGWPANEIQSKQDQAYISYGKIAYGPTWYFSGLSDDAFKALGIQYFNNVASQRPYAQPIAPTSQINNPGVGVEPPNAEISVTRNADGSVAGRIPNTSVVVNLPKASA